MNVNWQMWPSKTCAVAALRYPECTWAGGGRTCGTGLRRKVRAAAEQRDWRQTSFSLSPCVCVCVCVWESYGILTHGSSGRLLRLPLQDHPDRGLKRGQDLPGAELQYGPLQRAPAEHHRRGLHRAHAPHRGPQSEGQGSRRRSYPRC